MSHFSTKDGFFANADGNLSVDGNFNGKANVQLMSPFMYTQSLTGSNFAVFPATGYFQVPVSGTSGQSAFTGSLPAASAWAGGTLLVTDTLGFYPYLITGSIAMMSSSNQAGQLKSVNGTKLTALAGSSVGFWSDGKGWLVTAMSGTLTLAP